jgi:cholesterol oxidase
MDRKRQGATFNGKLGRRQLLAAGAVGFATRLLTGKTNASDKIRPVSMIKRIVKPESELRQRAVQDYHQNMKQFGGSLSSPINGLFTSQPTNAPWVFDVVVIGSGYGASICAARLSEKLQPGKRLCMIERGKERIPGEFPSTLRSSLKESRRPVFGSDKRTVNNPLGLMDLRQGEDVTVMSASALGGTSLINANVTIRPDRDVFAYSNWPSYLRNRDFLEPYYDRVSWELGSQQDPIDHTLKMRTQRLAAEQLRDCGAFYEAAAITVTRGCDASLPILNRQGMVQRPCTDCGDCLTGCNIGAKNSLDFNYIPLARRAGAEIFTQTEVVAIEKLDNFYRIHFIHHCETEGGETISRRGWTTARIVILGAGTMGSTELLLRSQSSNLQFSSRLGCSFSGNGDILGVIHRVDPETKTGGFGAVDPKGRKTGPSIQSTISFPHRSNYLDRVVVQDGGVAKAYTAALTMIGMDLKLDHTQVVLVSGHDGSQGKIVLDADGQARVQWPNLYTQPRRKFNEDQIRLVAAAMGGTYREMLFWKGQVGTVHPLGGCSMSDTPMQGVTNHKGQVFDGFQRGDFGASGEFQVHSGLYVCDGAVIPSSLGANPMLTISAVAERTADLLVRESQYADLFIPSHVPSASEDRVE